MYFFHDCWSTFTIYSFAFQNGSAETWLQVWSINAKNKKKMSITKN